jgi:hypothetical protein
MTLLRPLRALTLFACLVLPAVCTSAAGITQAIKPDGRTDLALTRSGMKSVRVALWTAKIGNTFPYKDALLWGGDVDELPQQVVSSIEVHDGDQMIFVPLSAYGDLGDLKLGSLDPTVGGFTLSLHGGNTATSYDVKLSFAEGYLVTRIVTLREFPQQRFEKTSYSFPKRTGND